ncbi:MAG TPA: bacillithiol biosynthesis deacetylase BshB1 [Acidobacteriota bacterium]|nr:bacillithiol biosynthesis deacetylase BshB1 [Acidobacteriota bacterium]
MAGARTTKQKGRDAPYDLVAFGAHPDDVEVGSGGVLCKLSERGYRCGIIYLTEGEMGTGGSRAIRRREADAAAHIMGADIIKRFDWGDTKLVDTYERRVAIARLVRKHRPRIILAPHWDGFTGRRQSHPDHLATGRVVMNGANLASLAKLAGPHEVHRVPAIYHFFMPSGVCPSFVVDITDQFDRWMAALSAHKSQFLNPQKSRDYLWSLETMARTFGARVGVKYGQGFVSADPLGVDDPFTLVGDRRVP